ncbi:MAG: hypothetical protein ABFE08_04465 [Armatimonadia bacterium]
MNGKFVVSSPLIFRPMVSRPVVCSLALLALLGSAPAQVQVSEDRKDPSATASTPEGYQYNQHIFTLTNGLIRYGLSYHAYWETNGPGTKPSPEGYLGMPSPAGMNWYGGGFLNVLINGKSLGNVRPSTLRIVERDERGVVEMLWTPPEGQVRLRFMLLPEKDYLLCELALQPKEEIKKLELALNCFPSFFTSWNKRNGWREVVGPVTTTEQGNQATLDGARDYWLLYQDTVFDFAKEKDSMGPCGLLFLPEQVTTARLNVTNYPVTTLLSVKPEVRKVRLAFWDFHLKTNAEALAQLRKVEREVTKGLRETDFRDRQVVTYDAARERAELEAMIAKSTEPAKWRKTLVPLGEKIVAALEAMKGGDLGAEQTASQAIAEYREGIWELKFDSLLND